MTLPIREVQLADRSGVILDWAELYYEWGDMLEIVLDIGSVK